MPFFTADVGIGDGERGNYVRFPCPPCGFLMLAGSHEVSPLGCRFEAIHVRFRLLVLGFLGNGNGKSLGLERLGTPEIVLEEFRTEKTFFTLTEVGEEYLGLPSPPICCPKTNRSIIVGYSSYHRWTLLDPPARESPDFLDGIFACIRG